MNSLRRILAGVVIGSTLLTACTIARAETVATTPNTDGGTIRITDDRAPQCAEMGPRTRVAWATVPGGETLAGCWTLDADSILVLWFTGENNGAGQTRIYDLDGFTFTGYFYQKYKD